ncbi:hypothetical protein J8F10_13530 [Gemmata sp. G18]|uniref:DUF2188 domain-containing protein n=1 Tax=Gemmata palustris TaxID=2822762 RepID=A0ABS5BRM5_9BACT|nr:hypothetical protein [Gemmata palustris]MBP3956306.1 hypothetical protein [Gemmata palustris]
MTVAKVRIFDDPIYTLSCRGWTGPDPEWVKALNMGYPPDSTIVADPVISAAHRAAKDLCGEVLSIRDEPDPDDTDASTTDSEG